MATKTLRVFAEYTSTGFVPMPTAGNIDYGYTLGSTFPATTPTTFQTDNPDLVVTVTAMTDFYVWIRVNGTAWNPSYTRNVRVYPDSPNINNVVMNMIIATGPAGIGAYTQIVQTSNRLYFNGATTDAVYNSKFAGKTYINELNFGTAPGLSTVATSGAYADLTGKPSLATVATSGLFTDLSSKPSGTAPLSYNSGTNSFVITQANTSTNGFLSSTDWNTFNNKFATPAGTTLQYVDGTGALQTFPVLASADKLVINVRNSSGVSMPKGSVVYINGATGNKPTVALAQANSDASSAQTLGLLQATLANNAEGNVIIVGSVIDLNTSAFTEGQQLYLSPTTAGAYTATKQYAPNHLVYVGVVTRSHVSLGTIDVKVQNGYEMDELHNVSAQSPSNNDGLFYNTTTSLWEKKSIATVLGYTPYNGTDTSIKALFSASAPLSYSDGVYGISQATTSSNGYLSSTDWNTFNGKESALTFSTPLVRTTNTISINQASASTSGFLSSTDWNTFNNKGSGSGTVTSVAMTVPTGLSISGTPITTSGTLALSFSAGYSLPSDATQATWTAKQATLNGTGFVKATGTTISYDNTSYLPLTGGVMSGSIGFSDSGKRGIYGSMGVNDNWFIGAVAFTTDSGFVEIATGDDGNEPIYVRQYNGDPYTTGTVARTATILDGSGNTTFPNTLTATTLVKSGGTSSQYLMADGSVSTITNNITGTGTINELAYFNTSSSIASLGVATYPSLTELAYVKGVTSSIQTQLNAKASTLSGTTNYVAKFTSSTAIGNSLIFDNGTSVGINTASPSASYRLDVSGNVRFTTTNSSEIRFLNYGGSSSKIQGSSGTLAIDGAIAVTLETGSTERFRIASDGAATFSSVNAKINTGAWHVLVQDNTSMAAGVGGGISFNGYKTGTTSQGLYAAIDGFKENATAGNELGGFRIWTSNGTNLIAAMTINSAQNVGIGVTASAMTAVSGIELVQGSQISSRTLANVPQLYLSSNIAGDPFGPTYKVSGYATQYRIQGYDGTHSWFTAPIGTAGTSVTLTERMRITPAGNVGINTTSPGNFNAVTFTGPLFDVAGVMQIKGTSANGVAILQFGGDTYRKATIASSIGTEDPYLSFGTASSGSASSSFERMRITSAGNVLIGVTSQAGGHKLQVVGATYIGEDIDAGVYLKGDGTTVGLVGINRALSTYKRMELRGSSTDGQLTLHTNGNNSMGTLTNGGYRLYVNGTIYATSNITANSDLTLKKNLKLIDNPINKLMSLNGYLYQWKENDEYQYGVIAQEVEKILPYAVSTCTTGIKGVSYNQITPLLIEGFKSHESEITILKARVKYLESKLA